MSTYAVDKTIKDEAGSDTDNCAGRGRLPSWFKVRMPRGDLYKELKRSLKGQRVATVCEEARCPNQGECWTGGTATLMILGDTCTRACAFCSVKTGNPRGMLDPEEPENAATVVEQMAKLSGISYVVITSVDRDDLKDFGSSHYAECIRAIRERVPEIKVEVLTPDFQGGSEHVSTILKASPDVFAHNLETIDRLHKRVRDRRAGYSQSIRILETAHNMGAAATKSGLMLGHGEEYEEVIETMRDLRDVGVDLITIGQYLQPTKKHLEVCKYWTPEEFDSLREEGIKIGFRHIASGPLVRSSYRAGECFQKEDECSFKE